MLFAQSYFFCTPAFYSAPRFCKWQTPALVSKYITQMGRRNIWDHLYLYCYWTKTCCCVFGAIMHLFVCNRYDNVSHAVSKSPVTYKKLLRSQNEAWDVSSTVTVHPATNLCNRKSSWLITSDIILFELLINCPLMASSNSHFTKNQLFITIAGDIYLMITTRSLSRIKGPFQLGEMMLNSSIFIIFISGAVDANLRFM